MRPRLFLPGLISAVILVAGGADLPFLPALRTESTYGWWVVVLYPLAAILAATQGVLCVLWALRQLRVRHRS